MSQELDDLSKKLRNFGKENLSDILHFMATELRDLYRCRYVRIYLEDLYEGMLICQYVAGSGHADDPSITQFIAPPKSFMSRAFFENRMLLSWNTPEGLNDNEDPFAQISGIRSSAIFPITHQLRSIGALSLDWEKKKSWLAEPQIADIQNFLSLNSGSIDKAKRFHQQISFSRHLDLARKKEAAWRMVRSAVNLIDKLALASVLVPSSTQNPITQSKKPMDLVEVMAVYSRDKNDALVYSNNDQISIANSENLINRIVDYDPERGLVARSKRQGAIYTADIMEESFTRKAITSKINLVSLYQISKFAKSGGQFICAVHYYTNEQHEFTEFEKRLLEDHASMIEQLIVEETPERIEIQILSEIEELLSNHEDTLQEFLHKILDKVSELIGSACGSVSILQAIDGKPCLVVETEDGKMVGAKSRGWMKSKIPLLLVGGEELAVHERSLNGYCAHTARPVLVNNVHDRKETKGFYRNFLSTVQSELAVPIIYGSSVIGVITQDSFRKHSFTAEHKRILQIIASLISQKVYNLTQIEELRQQTIHVKRDIEYRDPKVSSYYFGNVIGKSSKIHHLVRQIDTVVESVCRRMLNWDDAPQTETMMGLPCLLINGPTGAGKEFFFNNIYSRISEIFQTEKGVHFKTPLRKTNIAAYSGELTYSELFGHAKGAFTGAEMQRRGILEEADGGVVFLDEIGDADPKTQVQLLRFLDTGVFVRLGENQPKHSRIFLIAATNKNLREEIRQGAFREDLYQRLNALSFHIPSLNDRKEDIEDLATHFLGILEQTYRVNGEDKSPLQLASGAIDFLKAHHFKGNVRELKNILLRSMLFCRNGVITRNDVADALQSDPVVTVDPSVSQTEEESILDRLESGQGDFWSEVHLPFKRNQLTREAVLSLYENAKDRYHANLPGLAVKLRAVRSDFENDPQEKRRFLSFKNFLYKTIKITQASSRR
ncbi:MAG: GAF domain-containing protein [Candidatus Nitrohelix vancouverensis]|uniref:GAF domain-containing protein n=1 Tax=Candidatus Nitrohelix vancouverensis TaxID=2705534 RepID=A0A7T0C429_9BACT|nr:MAG: GAF domain-containing protein [Candidatus Nitrohelix vancouverensis]